MLEGGGVEGTSRRASAHPVCTFDLARCDGIDTVQGNVGAGWAGNAGIVLRWGYRDGERKVH